jgi:hypothetical protein
VVRLTDLTQASQFDGFNPFGGNVRQANLGKDVYVLPLHVRRSGETLGDSGKTSNQHKKAGMSKAIVIGYLAKVSAANVNAPHTVSNMVVAKKVTLPGGSTIPYISGQAARRMLRDDWRVGISAFGAVRPG